MTRIMPTARRRRVFTVLVSAAAGIALGGTIALAAGAFDGPDRQQVVAERGAEVMPFDLDATTHLFEPTGDGGVETVVADDPADTEQIGLIQQHLREEAAAFARGEFDDPAQIHGADMPGLSTLEANADRISITYRDRGEGGEVQFTTADPLLVTALHQQVRDMIRDLLTEGAQTGDLRDDVAPDELASYCLHALTAASALRSKAAIRRLVTVTLAGLRPPR